MPLEYSVEQEGTFVQAAATGKLTSDEILAYEDQLAEDSRIQSGFRELFDVSDITESEVQDEHLPMIAERVARNPKRTKSAKLAIVARRPESFDRARRYERFASLHRQNVVVFNDIATARIWLGRSELHT